MSRAAGRKLECSSCLLSLTSQNLDVLKLRSDFVLISERDKAGLFIPSADVIDVCRIVETEIRGAASFGVSTIKKDEIIRHVMGHSTKSETKWSNIKTKFQGKLRIAYCSGASKVCYESMHHKLLHFASQQNHNLTMVQLTTVKIR